MTRTLPLRDRSPILSTALDVVLLGRAQRAAHRAVHSSATPPRVTSLILSVVRAAGGSSRERVEVAIELVAHFRSSLAAGSSENEAIGAFGDQLVAAQLIRRSLRRKRGRFVNYTRRATFGIAAVTLVLAVAYVGVVAR
ncbi:MAG: hypothetical protein SGJ09_05270 [Phycisphaerae bacterium]|nr:hypothetical protein [Phycisphaerae bacterium]